VFTSPQIYSCIYANDTDHDAWYLYDVYIFPASGFQNSELKTRMCVPVRIAPFQDFFFTGIGQRDGIMVCDIFC
jgi:hypothetical protein